MKRIGLTGGIGSGKTYVAQFFEKKGIPVYYSDNRAKQLMIANDEIRLKISSIFGSEGYKNGQLNRSYLAQSIFSNHNLKEKLNNIVHPIVRKDFDNWCSQQSSSILINEAAILFETGSYKSFDYTILVTAPLTLRIQRIIQRDNTTKKDVEKRIKNQWTDEKKQALASFVIRNDGITNIPKKVEEIIHEIKLSV